MRLTKLESALRIQNANKYLMKEPHDKTVILGKPLNIKQKGNACFFVSFGRNTLASEFFRTALSCFLVLAQNIDADDTMKNPLKGNATP